MSSDTFERLVWPTSIIVYDLFYYCWVHLVNIFSMVNCVNLFLAAERVMNDICDLRVEYMICDSLKCSTFLYNFLYFVIFLSAELQKYSQLAYCLGEFKQENRRLLDFFFHVWKDRGKDYLGKIDKKLRTWNGKKIFEPNIFTHLETENSFKHVVLIY
jgi:hypothetical protein